MSDMEEVRFVTHERKPNGRASRIELISAAAITLESSPAYHVKGWVHMGDLSVWFGPSGSGKTFAVLWLAYSIATGRLRFFGRRVRAGRVALFALEGANGLAKRVEAIQREHGRAEHLYVHRKPLILFQNTELLNEVIAAVLERKADLVIFDTLSRTMSGGNENSSEDMSHMLGQFGAIQAATGAHVLVVHHTGKNEGLGARGHSSLRAAADVEIEVSAGEGGNRRLTVTKGRDDADGQDYGFKLNVVELGQDDDGDPITTCTVEELDAVPTRAKAAKLTKGDMQALAWLREAIEDHGEHSPYGAPAGMRCTTREQWADMAKRRTGEASTEAIRKSIYRAITNLTAAKVIAVNSPYFWIVKP